MAIIDNILAVMQEKGMRAAELCRRAGISTGTFSDWKAGRYSPKTDNLQKITKVLEVPLERLTEGPYLPEGYTPPGGKEPFPPQEGTIELHSPPSGYTPGESTVNETQLAFEDMLYDLSPEDKQAVLDYISFLRFRRAEGSEAGPDTGGLPDRKD